MADSYYDYTTKRTKEGGPIIDEDTWSQINIPGYKKKKAQPAVRKKPHSVASALKKRVPDWAMEDD